MKLHITIDKEGVDGFGFSEDDAHYRKLRATLNTWRGMRYVELEITEEERVEIVALSRKGKWKELTKLIKKLEKKQNDSSSW